MQFHVNKSTWNMLKTVFIINLQLQEDIEEEY
jgi:hypothetical protein